MDQNNTIKHDVEYNVKTVDSIDSLNRQLDDLRIGAMAALEELDQLIAKNEVLAVESGWKVATLRNELFNAVEILRKRI